MAKKSISRYQITLETEVERSDDAKKQLFELQSAVEGLQKQAEGLDFEGAARSLTQMSKEFKVASDNAKKYNAELSKYYNAVQKQADLINYSLTEQGKKDRERLKTLNAIEKLTAEERKERAALSKRVLLLDDAELKLKQRQTVALRAQINASKVQQRQQKTASELLKADLKGVTDRIKKQKEYIKSLSATGKAYTALKKAGKVGAAVGKAAAVGVGGIAGITAAGIAGAQGAVDRAREAARIRAGLSQQDKESLISELYIKTGAGAGEIVDAINRVTAVLGPRAGRTELAAAAASEIRMPGASTLFRSQTAGGVDYAALERRIEQIQGQTGLTAADLAAAASDVTRMSDRAFRGGASQVDILALTAALRGAGVYDTPERQERALGAFLAHLRPGEDVFLAAQNFDWVRFAGRSTQARARAASGVASMDWVALGAAATARGAHVESTAERAAATARRVEEKRNILIMRVLEHTFPLVERVLSWFETTGKRLLVNGVEWILRDSPFANDKLYNEFLDIKETMTRRESMQSRIDWEFHAMNTWFETTSADDAKQAELQQRVQTASLDELDKIYTELYAYKKARENELPARDLNTAIQAINAGTLPQRAMGGVLVGPGIVGERGEELVIPASYSKSGRAQNIIQNISQTFSMSGNETTALSLSQAVRAHGFSRDMFLRQRHGGGLL